MGLRFRKSFKLAPGIRMGFSGSGLGFNLGPRGASVSIGKRGVYANASAMGFSSRTRLSGSPAHPVPQASTGTQKFESVKVEVGVHDDGELFFRDLAGNPVPDTWATHAKRQSGDAIRGLIQSKCDEINAQIDAVGALHIDTPSPFTRPAFIAREFGELRPIAPPLRVPTFWQRLFASRRKTIEAKNAEILRQHEEDVSHWNGRQRSHHGTEELRRQRVETSIYSDVDAMEHHLEEVLMDISWPRETLVAIEVRNGGEITGIDVDLPEVEDMPARSACVPSRGMKLNVKDLSATKIRQLYMTHVHSIGFRIVGEAFAALPRAEMVVLSAYSQRRDKATGQMGDEYLYSVRVTRESWSRVEFSQAALAAIDVVESLAQFDLRRSMTKTGSFKPVIPFELLE